MIRSRVALVVAVSASILVLPEWTAAATVRLFVAAGQSNAVGASANAADLSPPYSEPQPDVRFWFEEGPLGAKNDPSQRLTSEGRFIDLQPQNDPNHRVFDDEIENGFGPEISLGRDLADNLSDEVAIVKFAFNGASLAGDWNPEDGNSLYPQMIDVVNSAIADLEGAGDTVILSGFFWMQGESDATDTAMADAYKDNLDAFIDRVRTDFGVAELPFVLGRININITQSVFNVTEANRDTVRTAQENVVAADPNTYLIDTDDLPLNPADGLHFVAAGEIALGQRFAAVITIPEITISGRITDGGGAGVSGVTLNGLPGNPMTDANGDYSVTGTLAAGQVPFSAVVTPSKAGLVFTPTSRTYRNVLENQTDQNYTASFPLTGLSLSGPDEVNEAGIASFNATATYSEGDPKDVTLTAAWSVEPPESGSFPTPGEYAAPGTILADTPVTIHVEYTEAGITRSATHNVTVLNTIRVLTGLSIDGPDTVEEGATPSYIATATYDDSDTAGTKDVTVDANTIWSVQSGPGDFHQGPGQYTAPDDLTADTAVVLRAEYTEGGIIQFRTFEVTVRNTIRILTGLSIEGPETVGEGATEGYTATALYDDASTQDVTAAAAWSVTSGPGSFSVLVPGQYAAPATVTADTPATIRAEYSEDGIDTSADKDITVTNSVRVLTAVAIAGPDRVAEGATAVYTATATYDDASAADVTVLAVWGVAIGAGVFPQPGVFAAPVSVTSDLATRIQAQYTQGGMTRAGTKDITVEDVRALLTGLSISGPGSTAEGTTAQYTATAALDDGSAKDVTGAASWSVTSGPGTFTAAGRYAAPANVLADTPVEIEAEYSEGGRTRTAKRSLTVTNVPTPRTWYRDADGDGYGDPGRTIQSVSRPAGYVADNTDCDDSRADVRPGLAEVCDDGVDNDCDGFIDADDPQCPCLDADGDGVCDADDNCPTLANANQADRDNDGHGDVCDADSDGDGFFASGNDPVSGQPLPGPVDCDDASAAVNPDADEICDDGIDNDCDGEVDDEDSDCEPPAPNPRPWSFCAPAMLPTVLLMLAGLVVLQGRFTLRHRDSVRNP